jgi:hypothetical protein
VDGDPDAPDPGRAPAAPSADAAAAGAHFIKLHFETFLSYT